MNLGRLTKPLTMAVIIVSAMLAFGPVAELMGLERGPEPWWSGGECSICGAWSNIAKPHGGIMWHVMTPITGVIFLWGFFTLFRDLSQPKN